MKSKQFFSKMENQTLTMSYYTE